MPTWQINDLADSAGRQSIRDESALRSALESFAQREPRVVLLDFSAKEFLHVGIGGQWGFVEYVVDEPWKAEIALSTECETNVAKPVSVWFLSNEARDTEIPAK